MKIKNLLKSIFGVAVCLTMFPQISFGYEVECKPNSLIWTNITASDAFDVCQEMKSGTSSIGSGALNPHMSTPQDWDAISVLAISQYGECSPSAYASYNGYSSTVNNATGVMNFGKYSAQNGITPAYTFTSGLMAHASNDARRQKLIDNKNTPFVATIYDGDAVYNYYPTTDMSIKARMQAFRNNVANKGLGIMQADTNNPNETGGLTTWTNAYLPEGYWGYQDANGYYYRNDAYPVLVKNSLFGFSVGGNYLWYHNYGRCVFVYNL